MAVVSPDSAPVKRLVKGSAGAGMLIDASYGRSTRAVLIMDSTITLSFQPFSPKRWQAVPPVKPRARAEHQWRKKDHGK